MGIEGGTSGNPGRVPVPRRGVIGDGDKSAAHALGARTDTGLRSRGDGKEDEQDEDRKDVHPGSLQPPIGWADNRKHVPMRDLRSLVGVAGETAAAAFTLMIAAYYSIHTRAAVVDPDIWWHIRVGEWIAAHKAVPRTGILSQHLERAWVAYSWGFDLLVSSVHGLWGLPGIVGLLICFQVLISLIFLLAMRRIAGSGWWPIAIAAIAIYAAYLNPLRPGQFTLLFFTVELLIIFDVERRRDDRLLFWMAPLFFLWANTHIQFVYGMAVLALFVATRLYGAEKPRESSPRLLAVLASSVIASCIGPNGLLPYRVALEYATQLGNYQVIQELGPLSFRRAEHFAQLLLLMAACFVVGKRPAPFDPFRGLLLIITAVVSFRAMRDSWFVSMASAFIVAEAVGHSRPHAQSGPLHAAVIRPSVQYALATMIALMVSFDLAKRYGLSTRELAAVIDRIYPLQATEFVKTSGLKGPLYNDFNWGGFLIYRLPEHPVSMDPRADLYGPELFSRSLATANAAPTWKADPDLARANLVLIPQRYPLAVALAADPRFRLVYSDHVAAAFVRAAPADGN